MSILSSASLKRRNWLYLEALESRCVPSTVTSLADAGPGSLRYAIATTPPGGTVDFDAGLSGTITLTSGTLAIAQDVTIAGPGADVMSVSGNNLFQVFNVAPGVTVTISGLTIADGRSPLGGGIYNAGTLSLTGSRLSGNSAGPGAVGEGGGLFNDFHAAATITGSSITENTADSTIGEGGGIFNYGMVTIVGSTLSGNRASAFSLLGWGGGIENEGMMSILASTLNGNSVTSSGGLGGGIHNLGTLTIIASTLSGNSVQVVSGPNPPPYWASGGGIANSGTLTIIASTLSGNSVETSGTVSGGGIANGSINSGGGTLPGGTLTIIASTISGNHALGTGGYGLVIRMLFPGEAYGGGIFNVGALTILESTFSGNSAVGQGGTDPQLGPFSGNSYGGAIYTGTYGGLENATLSVLESTLSGNSASFVFQGSAMGGGIDNNTGQPGTLRIQNTILAGNSASTAADMNGLLNSLGHNLIGIGDGGMGFTDTDLVGTAASPLDPELGALQDNGGPTPTMALLPSSPAIDTGALTDSEWDQRGPGYPRMVKGATDIGAYEVQDGQGAGSTPGGTAPPSVPLRQAVAAVDRFFASQSQERLFWSRQHIPGNGGEWELELD